MNWQGSKPCSKRIGSGLPGPVRFAFWNLFVFKGFLSMHGVVFAILFGRHRLASFQARFSVGTYAALAN
jgi:hypothetical protein